MMLCSPTRLLFTVTIWRSPMLFTYLTESYKNHTEGQSYDCALLIVPCESNITRALFTYDDDVVFWFDLIHTEIVMTLVILVGIFGNVVNIIIFSTTKIANDSTNSLLLALSVSDLMNLLANLAFIFGGFLCLIDHSLAITFSNITIPHMNTVIRWFGLLSVDLVTAISIQRAVAVILPFKVATIFSQRNTIIIISGLYLLCFCTMLRANVVLIPLWVFHLYFEKYVSLGYSFRLDYNDAMNYVAKYTTIRSCSVLFILMVCVSLTVLKLKWQAKSRLSMISKAPGSKEADPKMSSREMSAVKMSLTVCFVTFVIYSFSTGVMVMVLFYAEKLNNSILPALFIYANSTVFSINSCFNFFLYLTMCAKFKEKFRKMFSFIVIWR